MVTDRRQARLLTDPRSAGFIYPFLGEERSTTGAAAWAGCSLTTMAYRVGVLHAAGLLELTRVEARPGRPITYYQSSHDAYRVPLAATGYTDHQDQARRIGAPIYRRITDAYSHALLHSGTAARLISRTADGRITSTDEPPERTRRGHPLLFKDRALELTAEQADWLCAQLDATLQQLSDTPPLNTRPRHTYAVMLAAVPLED